VPTVQENYKKLVLSSFTDEIVCYGIPWNSHRPTEYIVYRIIRYANKSYTPEQMAMGKTEFKAWQNAWKYTQNYLMETLSN
jgi:hypothetical protein